MWIWRCPFTKTKEKMKKKIEKMKTKEAPKGTSKTGPKIHFFCAGKVMTNREAIEAKKKNQILSTREKEQEKEKDQEKKKAPKNTSNFFKNVYSGSTRSAPKKTSNYISNMCSGLAPTSKILQSPHPCFCPFPCPCPCFCLSLSCSSSDARCGGMSEGTCVLLLRKIMFPIFASNQSLAKRPAKLHHLINELRGGVLCHRRVNDVGCVRFWYPQIPKDPTGRHTE